MKQTPIAAPVRRPHRWPVALGAATLGLTLAALSTNAASSPIFNPPYAVPGGIDPRPTITSITKTNNETTITVSGLYGPFTMVSVPAVTSSNWSPVATSDSTAGEASITAVLGTTSFLKAEAPANYLGADYCALCHMHGSTYNTWTNTAHAHALETLEAIHTDKVPTCLKCHTVGYGLSNGFVSREATPHLAGVQCENCHGPAGSHVANIRDTSVLPKVTPSAAVCGGCHTDAHHPTYDEWLESAHATVTSELIGEFLPDNTARMTACGPCHSGSVRLTMLRAEPLPSGADAGAFGVTCAVCHDPHAQTGNEFQLRNPMASMIPFSYSTSKAFSAQYDPAVQMCAQCHNMRGAVWTGTSRPPHHSPQYNMLIGNISSADPSFIPPLVQSSHRNIEKQCTHCHVAPHTVENPDPENPNSTGHTFEPHLVNCAPCHDEVSAGILVESTQSRIIDLMAVVQTALNDWGLTKSPEPLRTTYGKYAWEFTTAGALSNPDGDPLIKGPSSTGTPSEQSLIPDSIKRARLYLYLVAHDASYGVHNSRFAESLLSAAKAQVDAAMQAP